MRSLKPFSAIVVVALATLAFAASLRGFTPDPDQGGKPAPASFKWWMDERYKRELALTAEQSKKIEETFQKAVPRLKVLKTALDEAESKFDRLVERGEDALVMEQLNALETARMELNKSRTLMLYDMQKALEERNITPISASHEYICVTPTELPEAQANEVMALIDKLEQDDDVQNVYHTLA